MGDHTERHTPSKFCADDRRAGLKTNKRSDERGQKLIARITRIMNLPRETESVRNGRALGAAPTRRHPSVRATILSCPDKSVDLIHPK